MFSQNNSERNRESDSTSSHETDTDAVELESYLFKLGLLLQLQMAQQVNQRTGNDEAVELDLIGDELGAALPPFVQDRFYIGDFDKTFTESRDGYPHLSESMRNILMTPDKLEHCLSALESLPGFGSEKDGPFIQHLSENKLLAAFGASFYAAGLKPSCELLSENPQLAINVGALAQGVGTLSRSVQSFFEILQQKNDAYHEKTLPTKYPDTPMSNLLFAWQNDLQRLVAQTFMLGLELCLRKESGNPGVGFCWVSYPLPKDRSHRHIFQGQKNGQRGQAEQFLYKYTLENQRNCIEDFFDTSTDNRNAPTQKVPVLISHGDINGFVEYFQLYWNIMNDGIRQSPQKRHPHSSLEIDFGEHLTILSRPRATRAKPRIMHQPKGNPKASGKAQARVAFLLSKESGYKGFTLRVDHDRGGLTLDIGRTTYANAALAFNRIFRNGYNSYNNNVLDQILRNDAEHIVMSAITPLPLATKASVVASTILGYGNESDLNFMGTTSHHVFEDVTLTAALDGLSGENFPPLIREFQESLLIDPASW